MRKRLLGGGVRPVEPVGERPQEAVTPGAQGRRTRGVVRLLPPILILLGVLYDFLTPRYYYSIPFLAAAVLVAAPLYSLRGTVVTAGLACLAAALGRFRYGVDITAQETTELVTLCVVVVLALLINRAVRRSAGRLASTREISEAAQRAVLPEPARRIGGLEVAARYEAAQAEAFIGGDLYAVQDTPHGVRLLVGDVRGKGVMAVATVAIVIGAFREAAEHETSLEAVGERLERALERERQLRTGVGAIEGFVTAVLAEIPPSAGNGARDDVVRVANHGHPPPLMLLRDGELRVLDVGNPSLPLGLAELAPSPEHTLTADFPAGAILLLYTDGLSEARNAKGDFYDPEQRLRGRVFRSSEALLEATATDVRAHAGRATTDDMALLAIRRPDTDSE